jgi:hypothetical protein
MAGTTPRYALPYPTGTDRVADGDNAIEALARGVEDKIRMWNGYAFSGPVSSMAVTFPVGRFTVAPWMQVTAETGANVAVIGNVGGRTAAGATIYVYGVGGTWSTGVVYFHVFATELPA